MKKTKTKKPKKIKKSKPVKKPEEKKEQTANDMFKDLLNVEPVKL
jgi:hypothetical protein